jgi:GPH family glycoside/pentoside/hexuronide:cation symporter
MGQTVGAYMLFYYVDVKKLPAQWFATALFIYSIYDAANNPVLGYISDRTKSRWGRRIPYILFGAAPYAILFFLLFSAPFNGTTQPVALLTYFLIVSFLWEGVSTAVGTGYYSLLPEMFRGYSERTSVAVTMNIVQTVGLLVAFAVPPLIYGSEALGGFGWPLMALIFGLITIAVFYIGVRGMFEHPESVRAESVPLGQALRATFLNRSFVTVVLAQTFRFVGTDALVAGVAFYTKYSIQVDEWVTSAILAVAFITSAAALWFWRKLIAERFEARTTLVIANAVMAVSVVPLALARSATGAIIGAAGLGLGLAGLILMGDVIVADVIDEDETRTGQRREGMYFGMSKFIMTLAGSIVALVFNFIVVTFGYNEALSVAEQAPTVGVGFRVFMAAPVIGGSILAIICLLFYPLHGERLRSVKAALLAKAEAKAAAGD